MARCRQAPAASPNPQPFAELPGVAFIPAARVAQGKEEFWPEKSHLNAYCISSFRFYLAKIFSIAGKQCLNLGAYMLFNGVACVNLGMLTF